MSRSGYVDDICDDILAYGRYRGRLASAIRGKRGQKFLKELAAAMDAMPEKVLISGELINEDGDCCAIGVVCKSRGLSVDGVDPEDYDQVADLVDISSELVREIEYENDEDCWGLSESSRERWIYMRKWVQRHIRDA